MIHIPNISDMLVCDDILTYIQETCHQLSCCTNTASVCVSSLPSGAAGHLLGGTSNPATRGSFGWCQVSCGGGATCWCSNKKCGRSSRGWLVGWPVGWWLAHWFITPNKKIMATPSSMKGYARIAFPTHTKPSVTISERSKRSLVLGRSHRMPNLLQRPVG